MLTHQISRSSTFPRFFPGDGKSRLPAATAISFFGATELTVLAAMQGEE
jgi:hypothetical protein